MNDDVTTGFEDFEEDQERIQFGKRLGAYVLDGVIIIIAGFIIGSLLGASIVNFFVPEAGAGLEGLEGVDTEGLEVFGGLAGIIAGFAGAAAGMSLMTIAMFIIEGVTGQSPGKMILKIKNKNEDGTDASSSTLWIRVLLKYSSTLINLVAAFTGIAILGSIAGVAALAILAGCFFVLGEKRQSFHDMLSKTAVFNK